MIYLWFSNFADDYGYILKENCHDMYRFWKPGSHAYKKYGFDLTILTFYDNDTFFHTLYKKSKKSYTFNNWNELWEWFLEKYLVDMI